MDWRNKLRPKTRIYLEKLLSEVSKEKRAYKDSTMLQTWVAMAILYEKIEKNKVPNKNLKDSLKKF